MRLRYISNHGPEWQTIMTNVNIIHHSWFPVIEYPFFFDAFLCSLISSQDEPQTVRSRALISANKFQPKSLVTATDVDNIVSSIYVFLTASLCIIWGDHDRGT